MLKSLAGNAKASRSDMWIAHATVLAAVAAALALCGPAAANGPPPNPPAARQRSYADRQAGSQSNGAVASVRRQVFDGIAATANGHLADDDFASAKLSNEDFASAKLSNEDFASAKLSNEDLSPAKLSDEELTARQVAYSDLAQSSRRLAEAASAMPESSQQSARWRELDLPAGRPFAEDFAWEGADTLDDVSDWRAPNAMVRRSETASEACFRKATTTAHTATTPPPLKAPEFNKKHPSNEYQVYSSAAPDGGSVLSPAPACGETTSPSPRPVATTTTRAGDTQVVGDIIEQLKDIGAEPTGDGPAPAECSRDGSWYSEAGGVRLDLVTDGNMLHAQPVESVPRRDGVLACPGWNVTGTLPFAGPRAPFVLIGVNDLEKVVAAFVGQCVLCGGRELVVGKWLVVESARDCAAMLTETVEVPDAWRRERLHALKADRLARLNLTDCFPSTARHTTTTRMPHLAHRKDRRRRRRGGGD